jgi:hypothetical protein
MAINLNASPYFDDFDANKRFNRILFKPGVAVQARELTQLQTLLQHQTSKLGEYVLKEGAVVTGCAESLSDLPFIKVNDTDFDGISIENTDLTSYVGDTVYGETSKLKAVILKAETGSESEVPDMKTFYLQYTSSSQNSSFQDHFLAGETLHVGSRDASDVATARDGKTFVVNGVDVDSKNRYYGVAKKLKLGAGIMYVRGQFVITNPMEVLIDKYDTTPNEYLVGFELVESVVESGDDETLLDPASGSYNFNAPGADRYKIQVKLVSIKTATEGTTISFTVPENFYKYADFRYSNFNRAVVESDPLNGLGKELAIRTYNESGDYTVRGHKVRLREHLNDGQGNGGVLDLADGGDSTKLFAVVDPGTSVVKGYPRKLNESRKIEVEKSTDYVLRESIPISTAYGNYIVVDNISGILDVDGGGGVDLYDTAFNNSRSLSGNKIGSAKVRHYVYESGTVGTTAAKYRVYLYDIKMFSGTFSSVRSMYFDHADTDGFADVVLESSKAVLKETNFNKLLWKMPYNAIRKLSTDGGGYDYNFTYTKEFDVSLGLTGQITITLTGDETFPYSSFTQTTIENNFIMLLKGAVTLTPGGLKGAGDYVDLTGATFTKNSSQSITINLGATLALATDVRLYVNVQKADDSPIGKSLIEDKYIKIDTSSHVQGTAGTYSLGVSDGFKIKSITASSNSDYETGAIDVTNQFTFNNGQTDNTYGHCKIVKNVSSTLNLNSYPYLLVKLDYFTHTVSQASFFCVDSYPVDDTGAIGIKTEEIPIYKSQKYGDFNLRNVIDFRPRITDTITPTSSVASAPVNPDDQEVIDRPATGLTNPVPVQEFTTDLEYYRARGCKIVLDSDGIFTPVYSEYSDKPKLPVTPGKSMELASFILSPYPTLSTKAAINVNRSDLGITVKNTNNKRYTMRDIGVLEKRIENLEYYTTLSMLEKNAADLTILDGNNLDRFKNGILVDAFTGTNIGAVADPDYHAAIDPKNQTLRPFFHNENIPLRVNVTGTTGNIRNNIGTLPYTNTVMQSNYQCSKPKNLVTELLFNYVGDIKVNPPVDNFVDTTVLPDVTTNFDGNFDAWQQMADAWGTQWGVFEDVGAAQVTRESTSVERAVANGTGGGSQQTDTFTTTTTSQRQEAIGTSISITEGERESERIGPRVVSTNIVGFMRNIQLTATVTRMKPNTRLYPFFDGEPVSKYCVPESARTASGLTDTDTRRQIFTDENGSCTFFFNVPKGVFRTGSRILRVNDDPQDRGSFLTTEAEVLFQSSGLTSEVQDTIVSMRTAQVSSTQTTRSRVVTDTSLEYTPGSGTPLPPPTVTVIPTPVPVPVIETITINNPIQVPVPIPSEPVLIEVPVPVPGETVIVNVPFPVPVPGEPVPAPTPEPQPVPDPAPEPVVEPPILDIDWGMIDVWENQNAFGRFFDFGTDPLAQTFKVTGHPGGVFIDSVDLFFETVSSTNGINLQIREVINGVPGPRVLPFADKYVGPADMFTSYMEGSTPVFNSTNFRFDAPVFLQNDTSYCIVPMPEGNDESFRLWVSELGENQVATQDRISKQPHDGILFSSANNISWTPIQSEDMMFAIRKCVFDISANKTINLNNKNIDWISFDSWATTDNTSFEPGRFVHSFNPTITSGGAGYTSPPTLTFSGGNGSGLAATATVSGGEVNSITITNPGSGYTAAPTVNVSGGGASTDATITLSLNVGLVKEWNSLYNYGAIEVSSGVFTVGDMVGSVDTYATITSFTNKIVDAVALTSGQLSPSQTSLQSQIAFTKTGASLNTTYSSIPSGVTEELEAQHTIYSYSEESRLYSGNKTGNVRFVIGSSNPNLSPVLDIEQISALCLKNDLNNTAATENGRRGGDASSRYISRRVVLDEGQDAEDLNVYLTADVPPGSGVSVYGKFLNSADDGSLLDDAYWQPLTLKSPPFETQAGYQEYLYGLADKGSGNAGLNSGIFEYDVETVGSIAVTAGGSGYTSPPTVQITHSGGGYGAKAVANITGSVVSSIDITDGGRDYDGGTITIAILGGGGTGATATASSSTVTYSSYKSFAVKIVPQGSNTATPPLVKDMRAIALQA